MLSSKSLPPCRTWSQVHRRSVTGMVMNEMAVSSNKSRPTLANREAENADALGSGQLVLEEIFKRRGL
jgi:hypothetical protein